MDTELTDIGVKQAMRINSNFNTMYGNLIDIDTVLTSPLRRTLRTADLIFKNKNKKIVALDCLKEYPQSGHICNKRMDVGYLKQLYPNFDFNNINNDVDWGNIKRTRRVEKILLKRRIEQLIKFIKNHESTSFAVVGHCSYFNMLLDQFEKNIELKHVFPYKFILRC